MTEAFTFLPLLFFIVWMGVVLYVVLLATRLVNAVEKIAGALTVRPPDTGGNRPVL